MCRTDPGHPFSTMRWLRLSSVAIMVWIGTDPRLKAFDAKEISKNQATFAVNFNEGDVNEILAHSGITNLYVYEIARDSRGAALFAYFVEIRGENRGALIITESTGLITNLPGATGPTGFRDDLTKAYSLEGDYYVFSGGQRLPAKGKTQHSRLSVIGSPGNEVLALSYPDEPTFTIVYSREPQRELFHLDANKEILVRKLFWKNGTIYVLGPVYVAKDKTHRECWTYREKAGAWTRESRISIPGAEEVLDLDPESPNILCYKWGLMHKKAFLFNLEMRKSLNLNIEI